MRYPAKTFQQTLDGDHVITEHNGTMSREQILLKRGARVEAGTVLGKINLGAQTVGAAAAAAGNTGNGVMAAAPTADANVPAGDYNIVCIEPAANGGTFEVYKPDGTVDGIAKVGVAYNGSINFTLNDGAADFVAGDEFTVNVGYAVGSGLWTPLNLAANDGSQIAAGVLRDHRDGLTTADTRRAVANVRSTDFNGKKLTWPAGITDNQKKAAIAQLAATDMLVRY